MKNLAVAENGASIKDFTSQYHHESRCLNLMTRDPSLVWFTHTNEILPQHVVIELVFVCIYFIHTNVILKIFNFE